MAKIELETLDGLPAHVQKLATEADGKYTLDLTAIPEPEDATELKNALNMEREKRARARQEKEDLLKAQQEADRKRAEEQGEFRKLYETEQQEKARIAAELAEYREKVTRSTLEGEAGKIAAELSRDTARAALLAEQAAKFIKPGDDGLKFEIGGVQVDRAKALDHLRASFPFLVDGSQASGGGATGGNGGAVSNQNPFKRGEHFSLTEQARLKREEPDTYARLKAAAEQKG